MEEQMNNLDKVRALRELKINLISRFHKLSREQIIQHKDILNLGRYHLMINSNVEWDIPLIADLSDLLDWSAIWKINGLQLDFAFFEKFHEKIDFGSIHLSNNIKWSEQLLAKYGDRFDWSRFLITKEPLSNVENLRRFSNKLNWEIVSERIKIEFNDENIAEFADNWDWKKLSRNVNLPITAEFVKKYIDKLDFAQLSQNPASIKLIYKYPSHKKWRWDLVPINPAIVYDKQSFDFVFFYFKQYHESKLPGNRYWKDLVLNSFLRLMLYRFPSDFKFFISDEFIDHFPWESICTSGRAKLPLAFIDRYKEKLDFKQPHFLSEHKDVLTTDFINQNLDLFDIERFGFCRLKLTTKILEEYKDRISWVAVSYNEKIDWTWDFIESNINSFNLNVLSNNYGVYSRLIMDKMTQNEINELLNNGV